MGERVSGPDLADDDLPGSQARLRTWLAAHPSPDDATLARRSTWPRPEIVTFRSADHREALEALTEDRRPEFRGL